VLQINLTPPRVENFSPAHRCVMGQEKNGPEIVRRCIEQALQPFQGEYTITNIMFLQPFNRHDRISISLLVTDGQGEHLTEGREFPINGGWAHRLPEL
jgi:hypothetical protein